MGAYQSRLPQEDAERFEKQTFFNFKEIDRLFGRFEDLGGSLEKTLPVDIVLGIPELKTNPFRHRIVFVFSSMNDDGNRYMRFEDFLQMMNAFAPRTSIEVKAFWAFKLYGMFVNALLSLHAAHSRRRACQ